MFIFPFQHLVKAEIPSIQKGPVLQKLTVECPFTSPQRQVGYLLSSQKAVPAVFFYFLSSSIDTKILLEQFKPMRWG